jgi:hypothetical protein
MRRSRGPERRRVRPPWSFLAVAVSLGAGLIVLRTRRRSALTVGAALAVGFVVFDGADLRHQASESRATLLALAALTAAIHGLAALGVIAVIVRCEAAGRRTSHEPYRPSVPHGYRAGRPTPRRGSLMNRRTAMSAQTASTMPKGQVPATNP